MSDELTHFDAQGRAHMVDVGAKPETRREAVALGKLSMQPETLNAIQSGKSRKGDVLGVARIAGIMAAKQTGALIPLCHPIPLTHVGVEFAPAESGLWLKATVRTVGRTGVEMEALAAVQTAALTVYDMCKAIDRGMVLGPFWLGRKTGGRSGDFTHPNAALFEGMPADDDTGWR